MNKGFEAIALPVKKNETINTVQWFIKLRSEKHAHVVPVGTLSKNIENFK